MKKYYGRISGIDVCHTDANLAEEMLAALKEAYKYLNEEVRVSDDGESELIEMLDKLESIITKAEEA
jgi:hypothetical protein